MESLEYSLRPLNWNLSLCGCPIFPDKREFVNHLLKLHGIILIIFLIILSCNQTTSVGLKDNSPTIIKLIMLTWDITSFGYFIFFILIVWKSRREIRHNLKEISEFLTQEDHSNIFRFAIKLFLYKLIYMIVLRGPYLFFIVWEGNHHWSSFNPTQIMVVYYQVHDPFIGTLSLYLTLLKVVHLAESNIISGQKKDVLNHRVVYYAVKRCTEIKENISSLVSILVFIMFGSIFIHAVCNIIRFQFLYFHVNTTLISKIWIFIALVRLLIHCIEVFTLVFMTHKFSLQSQKTFSVLENTIVQSQDINQWLYVLNEIKVAQRYEYRAFDFFSINRNFLLSFFSSFVTLTVLFIQLISQAIA